MHCDLCLTFRFNLYFPVKEFEKEIDGEIHHRHHLLSTVALIASPGYDVAAEDPLIFSDPESEPSQEHGQIRIFQEVVPLLPKYLLSSVMPSSKTCNSNMTLQ